MASSLRALVVPLLLLGCTGAPPPPDPDERETHPWGLTQCQFVIASLQVDPARLQALLPEGFAPAPARLSTLPAGSRATFDLDAYRCEEGVAFNGTIRDLAYGSHYAPVRPPDALAEAGYDAVFVKWDPLIPDAPRREALVAAGMAAHDGDARVQIAGSQVTASLAFSDGGGFTLTGVAGAAEPQGAPLPFMEYTRLEGRRETAEGTALARWHARLHDAQIATGAGTVEIQTPWVRELVGAERAPATFIAGTWNLDEADVEWPVAWP